MWAGMFLPSEPVHLLKQVPTNVIQILFIEKFTIFPSQVKERCDFWYGLELSQFLSYNLPVDFFLSV